MYVRVCIYLCVFYIFLFIFFFIIIYHGLTMSCFATAHQSACLFFLFSYSGMRIDIKYDGEQKGLCRFLRLFEKLMSMLAKCQCNLASFYILHGRV